MTVHDPGTRPHPHRSPNPQEFIELCDAFEESPSPEGFTNVIHQALKSEVIMFTRDKMANLLECSRSTIDRWAKGTAHPLKKAQLAIVEDLRKLAEEQSK